MMDEQIRLRRLEVTGQRALEAQKAAFATLASEMVEVANRVRTADRKELSDAVASARSLCESQLKILEAISHVQDAVDAIPEMGSPR